ASIAASPKNPEAYYNLGLTYVRKGEWEKGIEQYTHAIHDKPDYAEAYLERGRAYRYNNDLDHAITDYTYLIEQLHPADNKDLARAYNYRAFAYFSKGN